MINEKIVKRIELDVSDSRNIVSVFAKQFDTASRFLNIQLKNGKQKIFVDKAMIVCITALRKDKKYGFFEGEVEEDGTVTVPLDKWILSIVGACICAINITNAERTYNLGSANFTVSVQESVSLNGEQVEEEDPAFLAVLKKVDSATEGAIKRIDEAYKKFIDAYIKLAKGYSDSAANSASAATNAKNAAEKARDSASSSATAAANSQTSSQTSASNAKTSENNVESMRNQTLSASSQAEIFMNQAKEYANQTSTSTGGGFFIDTDGYISINYGGDE